MGELLSVAIQIHVADYLIRGGMGQACFPSVQDEQGCRKPVFCITPRGVYPRKRYQGRVADTQWMAGGEKPSTMIS